MIDHLPATVKQLAFVTGKSIWRVREELRILRLEKKVIRTYTKKGVIYDRCKTA